MFRNPINTLPIQGDDNGRFIPLVLDWRSDFGAYVADLTSLQQNNTFGVPRSIYIDNGDSAVPIFISVSVTGFTFTFPARAVGTFPIAASNSSTITFETDAVTGGAEATSIVIYNKDVGLGISGVEAGGGASAQDLYGNAIVVGPTADGAAPAAGLKPVMIAGLDPGTGFVQTLQTDASGALVTTPGASGSQTVIGPIAPGVSLNLSKPVIFGGGNDSSQATVIRTDIFGNLRLVGNVDNDAVDSGSPIKIGGLATGTVTPVAVGDRVNARLDLWGNQFVRIGGPNNNPTDVNRLSAFSAAEGSYGSAVPLAVMNIVDDGTNGQGWKGSKMGGVVLPFAKETEYETVVVTLASGIGDNLIISGVASKRIYITGYVIHARDGSGLGPFYGGMLFKDGSGGTVKWNAKLYVDFNGGDMSQFEFTTPIKLSVNTGLYVNGLGVGITPSLSVSYFII